MTATEPGTRPGIQILRTMAYVVLAVAGMKAASEVLIPILLAAFLAIVCIPPTRALRKRGVPNGLAIPMVVVGLMLILVVLLLVVGNSIAGFKGSLDRYQGSIDEVVASVENLLEQMGVEVEDKSFKSMIDSKVILGFVASAASSITTTLSDVLVVLLVVVFMLFEAVDLPGKIRLALGRPDDDLSAFRGALDQVYGYLSIKTIVSLITGVLAGVLCALMGVDFPILWGLVAFLFNFIPNVGSILAAIPAVLLCILQPEQGIGPAALLAGGYLAINTVVGNVIEPRLMGRRLGLSPLVVMLSLLFWSWVWGPIGMLLSVPLTTVVKIILEGTPEGRPVAILLGPGVDEIADAPDES